MTLTPIAGQRPGAGWCVLPCAGGAPRAIQRHFENTQIKKGHTKNEHDEKREARQMCRAVRRGGGGMTTSEIVALVEKFTCKTYPKFARPIYRGEYAYATDGRICIRARMPGGKFEGDGSIADKIDSFCHNFDTATPLPGCFVDVMSNDARLLKRAADEYDNHKAEAARQLRGITTIKCPHCGEDIRVWDFSTDIVDEDEERELRLAAAGRDGFEASFPVWFSFWNATGNEIIAYNYARRMIEACGEDGEYRFGLNNGRANKFCFAARSADKSIDVVAMCITKDASDIFTVGTPARRELKV